MTQINIRADEVAETRWQYVVSHEAWYAESARRKPGVPEIEIMVQRASVDGGVFWEFGIRMVSQIALRVEVFPDAWAAFGERPDLFAALSGIGGASVDEVREVLDNLGFADVTERETPERYRDKPAGRHCPDGGTCHHRCSIGCFRVETCAPLSGVYADDRWPDPVRAAHGYNDGHL